MTTTIVTGGYGQYDVGKLVAETPDYQLYLATTIGTGRPCLVQVALDASRNGVLDRNAYFLGELATKAGELEQEYAQIKGGSKTMLNYHFGFPALLDTFLLSEQGGRRVTVLAFNGVESISSFWPASKMIGSNRRIDIRTSAWIMGKLLKLLTFAHSQGILVGNLQASNILIQPSEHFVLIFDWSDASPQQAGVTAEAARKEIAEIARVVITLVGGDLASRVVPREGNDDGLDPYADRLFQLAAGASGSAQDAHAAFYALLTTLGWSGFHPFTDHPKR